MRNSEGLFRIASEIKNRSIERPVLKMFPILSTIIEIQKSDGFIRRVGVFVCQAASVHFSMDGLLAPPRVGARLLQVQLNFSCPRVVGELELGIHAVKTACRSINFIKGVVYSA